MKELKKQIFELWKDYNNIPETPIETIETKSGIIIPILGNENPYWKIQIKVKELFIAAGLTAPAIKITNLLSSKTEEIFEERFNNIAGL